MEVNAGEEVRGNYRVVQVQNADGERDTTAQIIVQNEINYEPKVSVILPVYNVEAYLHECLDSVLGQTLEDIEVICVDDGSTDHSLEILEGYARRDRRITILVQENLHAGIARNAGLTVAKGEYLFFGDSDDFFERNMLKDCYLKAKELTIDIVVFTHNLWDTKLKKTFQGIPMNSVFRDKILAFEDYPDTIFIAARPPAWNKLIRSFIVKNNGIKFESYKSANDLTFSCLVVSLSQRIYFMNKAFVNYRFNSGVNVSLGRGKRIDSFIDALKKLKQNLQKMGKFSNYEKAFRKMVLSCASWELKQVSAPQFNKSRDQIMTLLSFEEQVLLKQNTEVKISVIIPVYNAAEYIKQCLDSVLAQTLKQIEIICINDGSSDNSLEILRDYSLKDVRVKIINQENQGAAVARNIGLKEVRGEFIAFIDPDDFYPSSDVLEKLYNTALEHHVDVCGGSRLMIVDAEGKQMNLRDNLFAEKTQPISYIETQQDFGYTLYIYRTELIKNNNISFPLYTFWEDPIFLVNVMYAASKFYCIPEVVYCYRKNHKKRFFTEENVFHLLAGCYDNLHFAKEHHLELLLEKTVERLKKEYNHVVAEYNTERVKNLKKKIIDICIQYSGENFKRLSHPVYVSIIVPVYNAAAYLEECLQSICDQTLKEIEIICINDGSTDNSLEIIKEWASKDERIRYIDKPNSGYGNVINIGLSLAMGEYVGIVESDDYVVPTMYETLYKAAAPENLDIVKGNFKRFWGEKNNRQFENAFISQNGFFYGKILNTEEEIDLFRVNNINCNGIYKRKFIDENGVRLNETPGASYQDNGFWFQTFTFAEKILLLPDFLYMVRRDNPNSSVKSAGKVYCICDETAFIHEILSRKNCPKEVMAMLWQCMFGNYIWTYNRIAPEFKLQFLKRFYADFYAAKENGELEFSLFSTKEREMLNLLFTNYKLLHSKLQKGRKETGTYKRGVELFYRKVTGKYLDLNNPQTFGEKIQWLKLYDSTPIKTRLSDKYLVREWIKEKIGEKYLIPLLGVYDRFVDIDFNQLPNQFVIKCNHGSGYNIIVKDKSQLDIAAAKSKVDAWMRENFAFKCGFELHYRDIEPKILIEQYLEEINEALYDYRFFCSYGDVKQIWLDVASGTPQHKRKIYDKQWNELNFTVTWPRLEHSVPKPKHLETMIRLAESLSQEFSLVRVDFYYVDNKIYFGEMTFTSQSGTGKFNPASEDLRLGQQIKLPELAYDIDTGEYYKLEKKSRLVPYLCLLSNWHRRHGLTEIVKTLCERHILKQLKQARMDIKNVGTEENAIEIEAQDSTITAPGWFYDAQGRGQVLTNYADKGEIGISIITAGRLNISFLGPDMRSEGKRIPVWIDYKSIKIDGKEVLSSPIAVWHDKPWRYVMPVKDKQKVRVEYERQAHPYSREDLKETILRLNPTEDPIQENIDALTDRVCKIMYQATNSLNEKLV